MQISSESKVRAEFYDVDSMDVVYHANYIKFLEVARCDLLDKIGYGYNQMRATNYVFPITTLNVKYIRSLMFGQTATVKATLLEWENRIKIKYEILDPDGALVTKAETTQMAVKMPKGETCFVCPKELTDKVEAILARGSF
ncbi:MAG: acyl-CoA thioesterase [Treponema sp.]|nr:acyl-CoA thioesterase [Treponema sp.]